MSGGHWNYLSSKLDERAIESHEVWRLLSTIEHELDWGICGDTCVGCAKIRVAEAMECFFDYNCRDATRAIALMNDRKQNRCLKCEERDRQRK